LPTIEQHEVEVRANAADRDSGSFAVASLDGDPADPTQRFGEVGVRELADVLRDDAIHQALRTALKVKGRFEASAHTGHNDRFGSLSTLLFCLLSLHRYGAQQDTAGSNQRIQSGKAGLGFGNGSHAGLQQQADLIL
jgi:hypothetical protein